MPDIASLSFAPELPFVYVGGDPSLDLVNTVDWTGGGLEMDRLSDYGRLTRWAEGAGIVDAADGTALRREARERPGEADAAYRDARRLRVALRRLYSAVAAGEVRAALLDDFNGILEGSMGRLALTRVADAAPDGPLVRWTWREAGERLDALLWPVARSAAELLVSAEGGRVHVCAGEGCGWTFVDRSRNGFRRWCQMEVCGTREKSRKRASKR